MKYILSKILYHVGDVWCSLLVIRVGIGYRFYNWVMLKSVDLDKEGRIWKHVGKRR